MAARAFHLGTSLRSLSKLPGQLRCLYVSTRNASHHKHTGSQAPSVFGRHLLHRGGVDLTTVYNRGRIALVPSHSFRWNSGSTAAAATANLSGLAPGYIPPPPVPPVTVPGTEEIVAQLTALGEPTLQSLGLGSWYPSGLVQSGLEALHVCLDVPWWTAIVMGTVCLRLLVFPLVIYAQRNAAHMHNHMPIFQKLQQKASRSQQSGNPLEASRAYQQLSEYMKTNKVNPMKNMLVPMAQMPIFVSVFFGIREMANLPVESMKIGGLAWFSDLTIADPYFALPFLTMATFYITLEFGVDGVRAASMTQNMRYFMRALPFIFFPLVMNFPAAMLCYWMTSNAISLGQVMMLRIPGMKAFFKIPTLVVHEKSIQDNMKKPFFKNMKDTWRSSKNVVSIDALQRQEATKFKEAGLGAVPKTFTYDPTKVKKADSNKA